MLVQSVAIEARLGSLTLLQEYSRASGASGQILERGERDLNPVKETEWLRVS
jgi:hypothetical protein